VPLHVHEEDEAFFILSGRYRITCGEQTWHAQTHDFGFLPRAVPHAYDVVEGPASQLILAAPGGGIEGFFEDLAAGGIP
jgi:quercetin dioxygenase-like cupin family protein